MAHPTGEHLQCVHRILRYVNGTKDRGLLYWAGIGKQLVGYTLSSTEAKSRGELVTMCEAIWLKRLLKDLRVEVSNPMTVYCDNLNNI